QYAPGSTFKTIDTAAIFDHDRSLVSKVWPVKQSINIKGASGPFHNYAGESCGGALPSILAASCDTAFAEVGLTLGAHTVVQEAKAFGWCVGLGGVCKDGGSRPPLDLPSSEVLAATLSSESFLGANPPLLAYSSIGQYNDSASVLNMALVAAGIADNGVIMAPHLMKSIIDSVGDPITKYHPHAWLQATSKQTAASVRHLMLGVTNASLKGTAAGVFTNLQSRGIGVAAKTGTAEINPPSCATDDWLISMAPAGAGQTPTAVVVAVVPTPTGATYCQEATGATVAGPVVDQMLTDVLQAGQ
ncbi:MAG: penicillin-binding transpeptidase domain-containing protein, partial [Acidimicrobiales bacterium]